jgi:type IX secretion system PorP/SprF family membrane protein
MIRIVLCLFFLSGPMAFCQNPPAFRQFHFNPYLFNPAFAGIEGYTEVFVFHRQQWLNFNDAPVASGLNLQYAGHNRVSFGLNVVNQEVVALRNTSALLTFVYRIPISANQFLSFGISGGMGTNTLKLDDADYSNDPAVINALDNSFYADGNFGFLYTLGRLRIGFALPRLFGQKYVSPQDLGRVQYSQFRNQLYSASYKLYFGSGNFAIEPYFLYRMNRDLQNYWEGSALLYFKDRIWLGASYNDTKGAGFFFGMDLKDKLRMGYSYELPPISSDFIAANSHELHVQIRLGKKKIFKWAAKSEKPEPEVAIITKPVEETEQENVGKETPVISPPQIRAEPRKTETLPEPVRDEKPDLAKPAPMEEKKQVDQSAIDAVEQVEVFTPPRQPVLAKGHYVVVGSFKSAQNANLSRQRFISLAYDDAYVAQNPKNRFYYVYVFATSDIVLARRVRDQYRAISASRDAWVLTID